MSTEMRIVMRRARTLIVLLVAALLLGACGGGSGGDSGDNATDRDGARDVPGTASVNAQLKIKVGPLGDKADVAVELPDFPEGTPCTRSIPYSCIVSVACPGDEVCSELATHTDLLAARDDADEQGRACTMIYGGAITAHVTGTLDDKPVDRTFSRENGCAIADYDAAEFLWNRAAKPRA